MRPLMVTAAVSHLYDDSEIDAIWWLLPLFTFVSAALMRSWRRMVFLVIYWLVPGLEHLVGI